MNQTKIEWCRNPDGSDGHTWNPVVGCLHGCPYCYARRWAERGMGEYGEHPKGKRFEPRILPERLTKPKSVRKPSRIFVSSMGDLFGEWVPAGWIEAVLRTVRECPQHTFIFLTKNPARYTGISFPQNAWVGVTIDDPCLNCWPVRFWDGGDPYSNDVGESDIDLSFIDAPVRFVSLEPLRQAPYTIRFHGVEWVIVGGMTGPLAKAFPTESWHVARVVEAVTSAHLPLFVKDNCHWPERIQEWPKGGDPA